MTKYEAFLVIWFLIMVAFELGLAISAIGYNHPTAAFIMLLMALGYALASYLMYYLYTSK